MERKILVVDDEAATLEFVAGILEDACFPVVRALSGTEALELLRGDPAIRLIVTDVVMPEMDGKALLRAVREEPGKEQLPIILMSGWVGVSAIRELLDAGASLFLPKPVRGKVLLDYILQMMPPEDVRSHAMLLYEALMQHAPKRRRQGVSELKPVVG